MAGDINHLPWPALADQFQGRWRATRSGRIQNYRCLARVDLRQNRRQQFLGAAAKKFSISRSMRRCVEPRSLYRWTIQFYADEALHKIGCLDGEEAHSAIR